MSNQLYTVYILRSPTAFIKPSQGGCTLWNVHSVCCNTGTVASLLRTSTASRLISWRGLTGRKREHLQRNPLPQKVQAVTAIPWSVGQKKKSSSGAKRKTRNKEICFRYGNLDRTVHSPWRTLANRTTPYTTHAQNNIQVTVRQQRVMRHRR